jgi:hypothetical protein
VKWKKLWTNYQVQSFRAISFSAKKGKTRLIWRHIELWESSTILHWRKPCSLLYYLARARCDTLCYLCYCTAVQFNKAEKALRRRCWNSHLPRRVDLGVYTVHTLKNEWHVRYLDSWYIGMKLLIRKELIFRDIPNPSLSKSTTLQIILISNLHDIPRFWQIS